MSLAPCGQLLVETRKEYHTSRRKESETDKADKADVQKETRGPREDVEVRRSFLKKPATKSSRLENRRAQDVVGVSVSFARATIHNYFKKNACFLLTSRESSL
jgi:hypothetical protein